MEVKIKLKIKDVEIELSVDEAKELEKILRAISGKEKPIWNPPITYVPPYREWDYPPWKVTYCLGSNYDYAEDSEAVETTADYIITYKY